MGESETAQEAAMSEVVKRLHSTTDAYVWAEEWCKVARRLQAEGEDLVDEGWMIGWFANAIETAKVLSAKTDAHA